MKTTRVSNTISVGNNNNLLLIAGPCQIESREHCLLVAQGIQKAIGTLPFNFVFKSSFDKANRTSLKGARGLGIQEGLAVLEAVKSELGIPVLTDVHTEEQVVAAGQVVDIIQIPAFLCRQTDLLIAAGKTNKAINVKKGQFLHPADMKHVAEKISAQGNDNILLCERGTSFGYQDLVVDMRSLVIMRELGYPVIFDGTHSVQKLGDGGSGRGSSGGDRRFIPSLLKAAVAVGVDGVFIECHEDPQRAPSDAASMLPLHELSGVLQQLYKIHAATL